MSRLWETVAVGELKMLRYKIQALKIGQYGDKPMLLIMNVDGHGILLSVEEDINART